MKLWKIILFGAIMALFVSGQVLAQDAKFVGASKCKGCHNGKKKGTQFKIWQDGQHSKAFETLGTPKAKEVAVKAGLKGDPQKSDECLQCHVTTHGVDTKLLATSVKPEEGVQCESCHGAGSLYKSMKVMSAKKYKADPEASVAEMVAAGMTIPDEKTCLKCHNEKSPSYKKFVYAERLKLIAHPNPLIQK